MHKVEVGAEPALQVLEDIMVVMPIDPKECA